MSFHPWVEEERTLERERERGRWGYSKKKRRFGDVRIERRKSLVF